MADREKVINELNECIEHIRKNKFYKIPCWGNCQIAMLDALSMLKEQEAVKPTWSRGKPFCGACGLRISGGKFCSECGRPIALEGR